MSFSNKKDKVVFIDGSNLYASAKAIHLDLDYIKLRSVFSRNALRTYYYTALPPNNEPSKLRPLMDMLQFNGYTVVSRSTKRFVNPDTQEVTLKGNMDVDITVDAMDLSDHIKDMVFFTGDGDFAPLLKRLQSKAVYCTVVSTLCQRYPSKHPMIADELRKQADAFVDLDSDAVRSSITRDAM